MTRTAPAIASRRFDALELAKFLTVGTSGFLTNVCVFAVLVEQAAVGVTTAATCSFAVSVANNYAWNRLWTFQGRSGQIAGEAVRFLTVSLSAYAASLLLLVALVAAGADAVPAQALAIVLVTPLSFAGSKLWSFRPVPGSDLHVSSGADREA